MKILGKFGTFKKQRAAEVIVKSDGKFTRTQNPFGM